MSKKLILTFALALIMVFAVAVATADTMPSCAFGVGTYCYPAYGQYCGYCHITHPINRHLVDPASGVYTKVGDTFTHSFTCKICGDTLSHEAKLTYKPVNAAKHYAYCVCGDLYSVNLDHTFNNVGVCIECGYNSKPNPNYWQCTGCHHWIHVSYKYCPTCKPAPTTLTLSATEINVTYKQIGTSVKLYAYVDKETIFHINWSSNNAKVARVSSNGTVTLVGAGEAVITAYTDNGLSATCKVNVVKENEPVVKPVEPKISISKETMTLNLFNHTTDRLTVIAEGVTGKIHWESSDSEIVKVDQNGFLTAKKAGEATIIVYDDGALKASCKVTVEAPNTDIYEVTAKKAGKVEVKFTADCKMTSFEVYYRKIGAKNWMKKTVTVNGKSGKVTLKNLKSDTEYEVSVCGVFNGTDGKKYKTEWSEIETIIVK